MQAFRRGALVAGVRRQSGGRAKPERRASDTRAAAWARWGERAFEALDVLLKPWTALSLFQRFFARHDEPWGTLNNLGVCYENMGDAARATKCYHKAVALRPQYVVARDNLRRLIKRPGAPATSAHQSAAHAAPPAELRAPPRTFVGPPSPQKASTYTENVSPPRSDAAAVHGPRAAAIAHAGARSPGSRGSVWERILPSGALERIAPCRAFCPDVVAAS